MEKSSSWNVQPEAQKERKKSNEKDRISNGRM